MSLVYSKPSSLFSSRCDLSTISFTTDHLFSSEGGARVQELLTQQLKKLQLQAFVKFNEDTDTFMIFCVDVDAERLTKFFIPFMTRLVVNDEDDFENGNEFDCFLISRTTNTDPEQLDNNQVSDLDETRPIQPNATWRPTNISLPLEEMISKSALLKIESLTGCELVASLNEPVIYISGPSEESCFKALHKLDVINKYLNMCDTSSISHVFYNEAEDNVNIVFQSLESIQNKLEQKTVLDWLRYPDGAKKGYREMKRTFRLRCCLWNPVRKTHFLRRTGAVRPAVRGANLHRTLAAWTDFKYKGRGDESLKSTIRSLLENPGHDKCDIDKFGNQHAVDWKASIMEWTKGIPAVSISTPLSDLQEPVPLELMKQDISKGNTVRPQNSHKNSEKNISASILDTMVSGLSLDQSHKASQFRLQNSSEILREKRLYAPTLLESNDGNFVAVGFDVLTPQNHKQCHQENKGIPLTINSEMNNKRPLASTCSRDQKHSRNRRNNKSTPAQMPMSTELASASQDPSEYFLKSIKEMSRTISPLRNWRGHIRLEAQFGRALIRKPLERFRQPEHSFPAETVLQYLLDGVPQQPIVNFTNILTTTPEEVQYLAEMKDTQGNLMWPTKKMRAVKYEFDWSDEKSNDSYVLEIDANTFTSRVKFDSWKTSQVLVHCPLRLWDIMVTAYRFYSPDPDSVGLHSEISTSLYVPSNAIKAKLEFMVGREYLHMRLNGIRIRRTCLYESFDKMSILSVTEVIDLKLDNARMIDGKRAFSASEYTTDPIPGYPHSWYEVAVMSAAAQAAFKGNESLEFGEETSWTEETLQKAGVFSAICLPACKMIKKMDGIGYYNDNGFQISGVLQSELGSQAFTVTENNDVSKDGDFW